VKPDLTMLYLLGGAMLFFTLGLPLIMLIGAIIVSPQ
jgi:hypothetical protein